MGRGPGESQEEEPSLVRWLMTGLHQANEAFTETLHLSGQASFLGLVMKAP